MSHIQYAVCMTDCHGDFKAVACCASLLT